MAICACCGASGAKFRCSRCLLAMYCNLECQRKHWRSGHKQVCKPSDIETVTRILTKHPKIHHAECDGFDGGVFSDVAEIDGQPGAVLWARINKEYPDFVNLSDDATADSRKMLIIVTEVHQMLKKNHPDGILLPSIVVIAPNERPTLARKFVRVVREESPFSVYDMYAYRENMIVLGHKMITADIVVVSIDSLEASLFFDELRPAWTIHFPPNANAAVAEKEYKMKRDKKGWVTWAIGDEIGAKRKAMMMQICREANQ